jgi:hypothetical protein
MSSRAARLAGFSTSISPPSNLTVGVVTATSFVGNVTGTATGLSGTPNLNVGVITATSYRGDGSQLTGVGIGASSNVNTTGIGTFGTVVATNDLDIPNGTTEQRPLVPVTGSIRYNTQSSVIEVYDGSSWKGVSLLNTTLSGDIGVFSSFNETYYINIASTGNASDFGDLNLTKRTHAACSSSTRGLFGGGTFPFSAPTPVFLSDIQYNNLSTTGNNKYFGELTVARTQLTACSSSTRGVFGGGIITPAANNTIDYITIASLGNGTDFGDLTVVRSSLSACSSSTRGIFGGGTPLSNIIDYITIATTGNATDFGDLTVARSSLAACSSSTRGVFGGGYTSPALSNVIDYITIASVGNATDFGDLSVTRRSLAACSSSTRGVFGGGYGPTASNTIDYITIASVGNALDFGDLTMPISNLSGCSNAHGGLS